MTRGCTGRKKNKTPKSGGRACREKGKGVCSFWWEEWHVLKPRGKADAREVGRTQI